MPTPSVAAIRRSVNCRTSLLVMSTILRDPQAIHDFVTGLAFFGTGGGGGRLEDGIEMLLPFIRSGDGITLTDPDELPDDLWTCSVSSIGGRDPDTPPPAQELLSYGLLQERLTLLERMTASVRELTAFRGVKIGALVSVELGSAATVGTILAANNRGRWFRDNLRQLRQIGERLGPRRAVHGRGGHAEESCHGCPGVPEAPDGQLTDKPARLPDGTGAPDRRELSSAGHSSVY